MAIWAPLRMASAPSASAPVSGSERAIFTTLPCAVRPPGRPASIVTTAMRAIAATSTRRVMVSPPERWCRVSLHRLPVAGLLEGMRRALDRRLVPSLAHQHHPDRHPVGHAPRDRHRPLLPDGEGR